MRDHAGAHRIQLDVAHAGEQVRLAVHEARSEASLEKGAGPVPTQVDQPRELAPDALHQFRELAAKMAGGEQVHVVRHQDVRMEVARATVQRLPHEPQEDVAVRIVAKEIGAVVAADHEVLGNAGDVDSGEAGHPR